MQELNPTEITKREGRLLIDATTCPQDIQYPTDLNLLSDSRMKTEELIDFLFDAKLHGNTKPRTYREKARKNYLHVAQKRKKSHSLIRKRIGQQFRFVRRNLETIKIFLENPMVLLFQ